MLNTHIPMNQITPINLIYMNDLKDKSLDFVVKYYEQGKIDTKRALRSVKERAGMPVARTVKMHRWAAVAASLLVLVAVGIAYFGLRGEQEMLLAAGDSAQTFILTDQTRVTLSPHSTLTYKKSAPRAVALSGDAYFEVTHDQQHPFTVSNELSRVKVLGTKFMVTSQMGASHHLKRTTDVYVAEGMVGFSPKSGESQGLVLTRGMKARLTEGENTPKLVEAGSVNQTAWATGMFHFDNAPIDSVLSDLSQFYSLQLSCSNVSKRLSGDFKADSSRSNLLEIISIIEQTLDVNIRINNE